MSRASRNVEDPRLAEMLDVIFKYAAGDLTARGVLLEDSSSLDGVMSGINILGEELEAYVAENNQANDSLRIAIVIWIERTYRRRRRQDSLDRLTPIEYETIMTPPAAQAA